MSSDQEDENEDNYEEIDEMLEISVESLVSSSPRQSDNWINYEHSFKYNKPLFGIMMWFTRYFAQFQVGTVFEMRLSSSETVASIKGRLQRLEGIPRQQMHLLFRGKVDLHFKRTPANSRCCYVLFNFRWGVAWSALPERMPGVVRFHLEVGPAAQGWTNQHQEGASTTITTSTGAVIYSICILKVVTFKSYISQASASSKKPLPSHLREEIMNNVPKHGQVCMDAVIL